MKTIRVAVSKGLVDLLFGTFVARCHGPLYCKILGWSLKRNSLPNSHYPACVLSLASIQDLGIKAYATDVNCVYSSPVLHAPDLPNCHRKENTNRRFFLWCYVWWSIQKCPCVQSSWSRSSQARNDTLHGCFAACPVFFPTRKVSVVSLCCFAASASKAMNHKIYF